MPASIITISRPVMKDGCCIIPFILPDKLKSYFRISSFQFECPDASEVPESIAVVPAVANLLPFAWVYDCVLSVGSLDETFYEAIPDIKHGYANMLSKLDLKGSLDVGSIVDNRGDRPCGSPLLLFSGGVDAWCTLIRHIDEQPHLVSVWGADIRCENTTGWSLVDAHSKEVAGSFDISYSFVKSNLRDMINYRALDNSLELRTAGYNWWHDVQHGIGLLSLTVPLAYETGAPRTYIASSFYAGDRGKYTCASDPTIDNHFAAGPMNGFHDGYELTRQDKIQTIVDYSLETGSPINLRVCFHVQSGRNCCRCEKCGRTLLGIFAAGGDPRAFGFEYSFAKLLLLSLRMRFFYRMKMVTYRYIQQAALTRRKNIPRCFSWLFSDRLETICDNGFKRGWERFHKFGAGFYHKLSGR